MTDKKLTKTQETELVAPSSFEEDGGLGQENMSKDDYGATDCLCKDPP